ncbi:hypothetical protein M2132_001363 [Dysgonomonas sp. PH5-45]|uniref:hypothetical protein n=1 Tax=unclassified Dysgonomonas TaxID=2630389 RepID=UPI0024751D47|nr:MULTISPECIES: hypothetical protein [unclassified Dysgonomonas]MDH6355026.1 hypothetical protein [Dysgonomonas sp. PH5-45]MDH6387926.1 hypothetical protein [Dysgonomonas sp. PH5-37]
MKKLLLFVTFLSITFLLPVLGNKEQSLKAQSLTADQMTGWATYHLFGKVKIMKSDSVEWHFNEEGDLFKTIYPDGEENITSYTKNPVTENSEVNDRRLVFGKNTRKAEGRWHSETSTFDRYGRTVKEEGYEGGYSYTYKYIFDTETDKFPSAMKYTDVDHGTESDADYKYEYLEFDKNGNWTKRRVHSVMNMVDNDVVNGEEPIKTSETEDYIETRTFVYY